MMSLCPGHAHAMPARLPCLLSRAQVQASGCFGQRTSLPAFCSSADLPRSMYASVCCTFNFFSVSCSSLSVSAFLHSARNSSGWD